MIWIGFSIQINEKTMNCYQKQWQFYDSQYNPMKYQYFYIKFDDLAKINEQSMHFYKNKQKNMILNTIQWSIDVFQSKTMKVCDSQYNPMKYQWLYIKFDDLAMIINTNQRNMNEFLSKPLQIRWFVIQLNEMFFFIFFINGFAILLNTIQRQINEFLSKSMKMNDSQYNSMKYQCFVLETMIFYNSQYRSTEKQWISIDPNQWNCNNLLSKSIINQCFSIKSMKNDVLSKSIQIQCLLIEINGNQWFSI